MNEVPETTVVHPQRVSLPMVCTCGEQVEGSDELSFAQRDAAAAMRQRAYELLTWNPEYPATDGNFLSYALYFLNEYGVEIDFVVDQWFAVGAQVRSFVGCSCEGPCPTPDHRWNTELIVSVQCDRVEDGIAALVLWFKENRTDPLE